MKTASTAAPRLGDRIALGLAATFAVGALAAGRHEIAAGAWLAVATFALAPLALALLVARSRTRGPVAAVPAADAEAIAWLELGCEPGRGGPEGGRPVRLPASVHPASRPERGWAVA